MSAPAPTIAAIATAPGRGGVGVIRLSGTHLLPLAQTLAGGKTPVPRTALYTDFSDAHGLPIDNGLLLYFAAPASFTGEDVIELQGHGGPVVMQMLLARCLELLAPTLTRPGAVAVDAIVKLFKSKACCQCQGMMLGILLAKVAAEN